MVYSKDETFNNYLNLLINDPYRALNVVGEDYENDV